MPENIIIVERDLDSFPCPYPEELRKLLDSFDYYDKYRVLFELATLTGARVGEITKAKMQEFDKQFTIWKYRIQKPLITIRYDEMTDEVTVVKDYKVRSVQLPPWFSEKLRNYFDLNRHCMDAGYLFYNRHHDRPHITVGQVSNMMSKKRQRLGLTRFWKVVAKQTKHKKPQYKKQVWYAISPHGFRRFYVSEMFQMLVKHGVQNALVMVGKLLGHSRPMHTTSLYLSPRVALADVPKVYDPDFLEKENKVLHSHALDHGQIAAKT